MYWYKADFNVLGIGIKPNFQKWTAKEKNQEEMLSSMIYQRVIKIVQPRNLATMDNRRRKQDEGQYNSQQGPKLSQVAFQLINCMIQNYSSALLLLFTYQNSPSIYMVQNISIIYNSFSTYGLVLLHN